MAAQKKRRWLVIENGDSMGDIYTNKAALVRQVTYLSDLGVMYEVYDLDGCVPLDVVLQKLTKVSIQGVS